MTQALLEVCVDTLAGARAAMEGGAARVELCSALSEGGLTPSKGLMEAATHLDIPCYAMIRPRAGLFHFTAEEVEIMCADVINAREAGLAGVVLGAQDDSGDLDCDVLQRLLDAAGPTPATLHRVIDVVPDPLAALERAVDLGFERVLTSGAAPEAPQGIDMIRAMVARADGRISVMPGCGLEAGNVADLVAKTGVREVHAACHSPADGPRAFSDFDPPGGRFVTDAAKVRAMVEALA